MYDNFIDLTLFIFTNPWYWGFLGLGILVVLAIEVFWRTDQEPAESEANDTRLSEFYDTYQTPEQRMKNLLHPADAPSWLDKLLDYYQFSAVVDGYAETLVLTDHKHFGLRKRTYAIPFTRLEGVERKGVERLIALARTNMNRRAQRAGLMAKGTKRGPQPKGVMPIEA